MIDDTEAWEEAKRRAKIIRRLKENEHSRTIADIEEAASDLELSRAQVYVLLRRYAKDPRTSSLLPKHPVWRAGMSRLSDEQEEIIRTILDRELNNRQLNIKKIIEDIQTVCHDKGISCPSLPTLRERVNVTKKKQGQTKKSYRQVHPVGDSPPVSRPLERVQIDHTLADLIIVDRQTRRAISRPWLTLVIDVFSRMVLGFFLSLERPSVTSVALAISHAILPKSTWMIARGINNHIWPARGIPSIVIVDNAKEFKASEFRHACDEYDIEI